jgi:hypothetical protein
MSHLPERKNLLPIMAPLPAITAGVVTNRAKFYLPPDFLKPARLMYLRGSAPTLTVGLSINLSVQRVSDSAVMGDLTWTAVNYTDVLGTVTGVLLQPGDSVKFVTTGVGLGILSLDCYICAWLEMIY